MNRAFAYSELFCGTSDGCVFFDNICSEYDTPFVISSINGFQRSSTPFKSDSSKFYVLKPPNMIADKILISIRKCTHNSYTFNEKSVLTIDN